MSPFLLFIQLMAGLICFILVSYLNLFHVLVSAHQSEKHEDKKQKQYTIKLMEAKLAFYPRFQICKEAN